MSAAENKESIRARLVEASKDSVEGFLGGFADNARYKIIGTTKFSATFKS
jgi:hypothetical protein